MKIVVLGGRGLLGSAFLSDQKDHFQILSPVGGKVSILDINTLNSFLDTNQPNWVVNMAAYTNVEEAENQTGDRSGLAFRLNVEGVKNLAECCRNFKIPLLHVSTEYIFDGQKSSAPYVEDDSPSPINWYGQTKLEGEKIIKESGCEYLITRISMPFVHFYERKSDIARTFLRLLRDHQQIKALTDVKITPTLIYDITQAFELLIKKDSRGIYHLSTTTPVSPYDFAIELAEQFNLDKSLILPIDLKSYNSNKKAAMLQYSWLDPTKFISEFGDGVLHSVKDSVEEFHRKIEGLNDG